MELDLNDFYLTLGKRRSGKTYFTKKEIIDVVIQSGKRIIIIDNITKEYGYLGLPTISSYSELRSKGFEFLKTKSYRISLNSNDDEEDNKARLNEIDNILKLIYRAGNAFVVYEEAGIDLDGVNLPILKKIAFGGRHKNIGANFNTQRPRKLPSNILSQGTNFFIFKITDNYDLIELKKRFGEETIESIKGLDNHTFVVFNNEEYQGIFVSEK